MSTTPTPDLSGNIEKNVPTNIVAKDFDMTELESFAGGDEILKEIENRIAHLEREEKGTHAEINKISGPEKTISVVEKVADPITAYEGETFAEKVRPFIFPLFLTLGALIFSFVFVFIFLNLKPTITPRAITNIGGADPVQQIPVKQVITYENATTTEPPIESKVTIPIPPIVKISSFENGTNTAIQVRFSYNKYTYDTFPDGMYLTGNQVFSGNYEGYKILATNRAYANDYMFGVDRNKVYLIGQCSFKIDKARVAIVNMQDSSDDKSYDLVGKKYFRGKMLKVLESSKPYIDCKPGQNAGEDY